MKLSIPFLVLFSLPLSSSLVPPLPRPAPAAADQTTMPRGDGIRVYRYR